MRRKSLSYNIIALEQGTKEWLAWRSQGIGASDAPAIMGESIWKSAATLMEEKCGRQKKSFINRAMARGTALEPKARRNFETKVGIRLYPVCLQSVEHEWLRASLDGLSADGRSVVEIKCGERCYQKTSKSQAVPKYYYGQLQHILALTDLPSIDFYCYLPGEKGVHLSIPRDDLYIDRLLDAEYQFWQEILKSR
jgi:putative phage-type endonuclease